MYRSRSMTIRRTLWAVPLLAAASSLIISLAIIRPFVDAPISFDGQATVLYFDRLVAGRVLEQQLSTTPKPLLTVLFGAIHALSGEWRPLIWATIAVLAAASALAAALATRAVGGSAGVAVGLVVAGTPLLIQDTAYGSATPWALLGWLGAAALLGGSRPRPGLAGVLLLLAALCRLETLVLVVVGGVAVVWGRFGPWPAAVPRPAPPPRVWLAVAIPFLAFPVMLLHDALLTGDPFFWIKVSQRYSDTVRLTSDVAGPVERTTWLIRRYARLWPAVLLAAVGLAVLVHRRRWLELVGLAGMGPGIAAFLVLLAARGLYAPDRYAIPVDLAVLMTAAVGFGWLAAAVADRVATVTWQRIAIEALPFAVVLVGMFAARAGPFDPRLDSDIAGARDINAALARALPVLREGIGRTPEPIGWLVPSPVRPRAAVDLGIPLTAIGGLARDTLDPAAGRLAPGQLVFFERHLAASPGLERLALGAAFPVGPLVVEPRLADSDRGIYVYEVTRP
jgi:hypothetical protein